MLFAPGRFTKDRTMRRLATLLLPALALTACAPPAYGPGGYGGRYSSSYDGRDRWADDASQPIKARIVPDGNWFGVELNRPAYVAVFEILPGRGVGMVYPQTERTSSYGRSDAFRPAGFSSLRTPTTRRYDWYDLSRTSRYASDEPTYYFLVASRQPLRISRFQRSPDALRTVLGYNAYITLNYRNVMDDLVEAIVPGQPDDDWTTDVYAIWPSQSRRDRLAYDDSDRYTYVYCADGSITLVPLELLSFSCRGEHAAAGGPPRGSSGNPNPPPPPADTSTVHVPGRRRPEPATPAGGGSTNNGSAGRRTGPTPHPPPRGETPRTRPTGSDPPRAAPPSSG